MNRLNGKTAIITGAARGQGSAEVRLFANEGAKVIFGDILDKEGREIESAIRAVGGEVTYVHLDVTKESDWQDAIKLAASKYQRLDILVNNAGIAPVHSIQDTTPEIWDRVMQVNATGVFLGTKYAIDAMLSSGGGSIVNISSISAVVGIGSPAYNASKGAVRAFTKIIAVQYGAQGIRCNLINPHLIDTPMAQNVLGDPVERAKWASTVPLNKIGTVEDIAYGVLYLASDESRFVTGAELAIDGGLLAQ